MMNRTEQIIRINGRWVLLLLLPLLWWTTGCEKDTIKQVSSVEGDSVDLSDISFDRTVSVLFAENGTATVNGVSDEFEVVVSGNGVTIVNNSGEVVQYQLSGSASDGFFKLYSANIQAVVLNGVSLANPNGAALNIQGPVSKPSAGKSSYLVTQSASTLADGTSYTRTPDDEDEKGVIFSEGPLVFSGSALLTVKATGKSGIVSDDYVQFASGSNLSIQSTAGHGVKGKEYILVSGGTIEVEVSANMKKGFTSDSLICFNDGATTINITGSAAYDSEDKDYSGTAGCKADVLFVINGGSLTITNSGTGGKGISGDGIGLFNGGTVRVTTTGSNYTTGDISSKAIKFDGNLTFSGSNVVVNCTSHEGIESKGIITVTDGEIYSYSASDDAINSGGTFTISGGYVFAYAPSNDGLDANGDCYIKGGVVYAIGSTSPEVAIDANTEKNYQLYVQGGVIIAIGGLESGASLTQSCYQASSWTASSWYALTAGSTTYVFKTPASVTGQQHSDDRTLVVSASSTPTLLSGVTQSGGESRFEGMMYVGSTVSGGSSVSLTSYSGGSGGPGGGGPGGGGPSGGGGRP